MGDITTFWDLRRSSRQIVLLTVILLGIATVNLVQILILFGRK